MSLGRPMAKHINFWLWIMLLPSFIISKRYASIFSHSPNNRCSPLAFFVSHCHLETPQRSAHRFFHKTSSVYLNRILFDTSEIDKDTDNEGDANDAPLATVTLSKEDYRTVHVAKILGLQNGDSLRAGSVRSSGDEDHQLAGLLTDESTITWIPEGKIRKAQPTKNGDPPGSLKISIPHPPKTSLWNERNGTQIEDSANDLSDTPPVSLLLALPRPLQLGRILPMVSQLGIDQLVLTNARKVPKDYFGSHIFRKPEVLRGLLVEGLAQSGDVMLPNVTVTKRLKIFMEDELDDMFPPGEVARVIAHPQRKNVAENGGKEDEVNSVKRMASIDFPANGPRRILVAVGPEGGWDEPHELDMFTSKGFQQISLGTRVLRSDVAVVSLLALAHEVCATDSC
mmetsp:Transcript_6919/g.17067  ORF Transcript_6919/g.17067 Transcript_6919/m.17067 type:complete len:397 (-) Transcript_6919:1107-2297(-)